MNMRPLFRYRHEWKVTYLARRFGNWIAPFAVGGAFGLVVALMLYSAL